MKYKTRLIDGHEVCFSADWIEGLEREIHFNWYYQQAELVYKNCAKNERLLEIGIGTGLLSDLLKKRKWKIQTLDIDDEKNPDFCASAAEFDYTASDIDVVLAFEVFEHMPFLTFEKVIAKIAKSDVRRVYFSLPWNERSLLEFKVKLPKVPGMSLSWAVSKGRIDTPAHFWELSKQNRDLGGKRLVRVESVKELFKAMGFDVNILKKINYIQYLEAARW